MNDNTIRKYLKSPPREFQETVLRHLEKMPGIYGVYFSGPFLKAKTVPLAHTRTYTSIDTLLIGLESGFKAAMGPVKPYGLKYPRVKFPRADGLPFFEKEVVEWYVTREEAHERRLKINEEVRLKFSILERTRPVLKSQLLDLSERFHPQIIHSEDREHHF